MGDLSDVIKKYRGNPEAFISDLILKPGQSINGAQLPIVRDFERMPSQFCSAGHGVGKTVVESWLALYFIHCYYMPLVVVTAPTMHQLKDIFGANVRRWYGQSKLKEIGLLRFKSETISIDDDYLADNWAIKLQSSSVPENLQGFHAKNIFWIADEASGINDNVMEVMEGGMTTANAHFLGCGNPTKNSGMFYDAFHKFRDINEPYLKYISLENDIRPESVRYCQKMAEKYGRESNVYLIRVLGQFAKTTASSVFQPYIVENALNTKGVLDRTVTLGVDPGAGGDLSVIFERRGKQIVKIHEYDFKDTEKLVDEIEKIIAVNQNCHVVINMDTTGLGWPIQCSLNRRMEKKRFFCTINPVNFANSPLKSQMYEDRPTELYFEAAELLATGEYGILDTETGDLYAQLTGREFGLKDNLLKIEDKKSYRKRNKDGSPNHSDAFVLCMVEGRSFGRAVGAA